MSRFFSKKYKNLKAYTPGEQPRDMQYIKLNTNESPYPPSPSVFSAVAGEVEKLGLYSDPECTALVEAACEVFGVASGEILMTNGSDEILNFSFMAFCERSERRVRFPEISYGFYSVYAELHGVKANVIPLKDDFSIDPEDYKGNGKMVVIANPNAPTGLSLSVAQIEEIVKSNPNRVVVVDEAYVDFGGQSCLPLLGRYENLLVVRTFSKSRCMAGGRLGYAFASPAIIEDLEKMKYSTNPYNVNRLTMRLGEATVDAESYYQEKCREIIRVREWTAKKLMEMGFPFRASSTVKKRT